MLDVALRRSDGTVSVDWAHVGVKTVPPLPVAPALRTILPDGLRRGTTVTVTGSLSLLFALLGAASADGAWCALVGFGRIGAEAAREYGVDLRRLALVPAPDAASGGWTTGGWTTAVGALLDAVDVVAARPPGRALVPGDVRRLAARARSKDAVLVPYLVGPGVGSDAGTASWPGADVRIRAREGSWTGIGSGSGRLRARRVDVEANGRGPAARPRRAELWLPAASGGVALAHPVAEVVALPTARSA